MAPAVSTVSHPRAGSPAPPAPGGPTAPVGPVVPGVLTVWVPIPAPPAVRRRALSLQTREAIDGHRQRRRAARAPYGEQRRPVPAWTGRRSRARDPSRRLFGPAREGCRVGGVGPAGAVGPAGGVGAVGPGGGGGGVGPVGGVGAVGPVGQAGQAGQSDQATEAGA